MTFSVDSKVGELLDNPKTKAILVKHIPSITKNQLIDMARMMSLRDVADHPAAEITPDKLSAIELDFNSL